MRQSLMEINDTKARLYNDKENSEAPCLKDQVEKISTRIDRIRENQKEGELNKQRDKKLRLEMQQMKMKRIMKTNYS